MKKVVVFSGAGISAESGLSTFRDTGGLWEQYKISEVATPKGWESNPGMVLDFYNERRHQIRNAKPNKAHYEIAALEKHFKVYVITQNIDDLHERAGSTNVIHLHGEIIKSMSTGDESLVYDVNDKIKLGDKCEKGYQLRPHVVWFGEMVPNMSLATGIAELSDFFLVIGTSLNVYPAAGLIGFVKPEIPKFLIDPNPAIPPEIENLEIIREKAGSGLSGIMERLLSF